MNFDIIRQILNRKTIEKEEKNMMTPLSETKIRIHSYESAGTVDGPGIRFVVFTQGCPLKCQYCHNPDTWNAKGGREVSGKELVAEIVKYETFMRFSKGGVTFSGGEPLLQKKALIPVFKELKRRNIHIAIDTAGTTNIDDDTDMLLDNVDLVMLDVKHIISDEHKKLTGLSNDRTFAFLEALHKKGIRTWVRWVVVPNLNDSLDYAEKFAQFIKPYDNVELVEILPYHKHGIFKWEALGMPYPLANTREPEKAEIEALADVLQKHNINTLFAK